MRIAICCNDTRGGVQPYIALGRGLRAEGFDVVLIAPQDFELTAREAGLKFGALSGSQAEIVAASAGAAERGTLATVQLMWRELPNRVTQWARETLAAAEGADLLMGGIGGMVTGVAVARRLGVPFWPALLQPVGLRAPSTGGVLAPRVPLWMGAPGIRASHALSQLMLHVQFALPARLATRAVGKGTQAARKPPGPTLFGFSPAIVEIAPEDGIATGYWSLPASADWAPPSELTDALADTSRPVVSVGFGSMVDGDNRSLLDLLDQVADRLHCRIVFLSGWSELPAPSSNTSVLLMRQAPHDWLFPRSAAVVHHGGAGTTGAALLAGVPQVVVPFGVDQPFWGERVRDLGLGPPPIRRKHLNSDILEAALRSILDDSHFAAEATRLRDLTRSEDGVRTATRLVARWA